MGVLQTKNVSLLQELSEYLREVELCTETL